MRAPQDVLLGRHALDRVERLAGRSTKSAYAPRPCPASACAGAVDDGHAGHRQRASAAGQPCHARDAIALHQHLAGIRRTRRCRRRSARWRKLRSPWFLLRPSAPLEKSLQHRAALVRPLDRHPVAAARQNFDLEPAACAPPANGRRSPVPPRHPHPCTISTGALICSIAAGCAVASASQVRA